MRPVVGSACALVANTTSPTMLIKTLEISTNRSALLRGRRMLTVGSRPMKSPYKADHQRPYAFCWRCRSTWSYACCVSEKMEVAYAKSDTVRIAYQVLGAGPPDLVFVPGFVSHLELEGESRTLRAFFEA